MKTAEEILKDTLGDIRYGLNGNEMNNQIIHAMEMYLLQSSLPSPSLPSDEEKKKSVINKILDDLPIREVRGEMSPDEWYGWFEEVYDKAFSLCSTRIAEMEREMKGLTEALKGELVLNDLLRDGHFKNKDGMPIVKYIDKPNKGDVAYIRHDAMVKKINSIIKSTTTP